MSKPLKNSVQLAQILIEIEKNLCDFYFQKISLEYLLTKYHEKIYRGLNVDSSLKILLSWLLFILKGLLRKKPEARSGKIFLSKITNKHQCNALIDPLKKYYKKDAVLFTPQKEKNEVINYFFYKRVRWSNLWSAILFLNRHAYVIEKRYREKGIQLSRLDFRFVLFIQLIAVSNWQSFFRSYTYEKIMVDFDRDNKNAALIAVAKVQKIPSFTLVHGVINPPFGFYPVITDEIWVWGNYQKELLQSFGLEEKRIKVVGNPIAKKQILKQRSKNKTTFGIALNPMGMSINKSFLDAIFTHNELTPQFQWIIKLHPSMKKEVYLQDYENENVSLKAFDEIDNLTFFESIDALFLGNSGIGYEALINDIPLLIGRTSIDSRGHDYIMIEKGKCPDIYDGAEYKKLLEEILTDSTILNKLLKQERQFLDQEYYHTIGQEAIDNVIEKLEAQ